MNVIYTKKYNEITSLAISTIARTFRYMASSPSTVSCVHLCNGGTIEIHESSTSSPYSETAYQQVQEQRSAFFPVTVSRQCATSKNIHNIDTVTTTLSVLIVCYHPNCDNLSDLVLPQVSVGTGSGNHGPSGTTLRLEIHLFLIASNDVHYILGCMKRILI
jgi:hypothetical protein